MLVHWIWFAGLGQIDAYHKRLLLERFSDPEEIYYALPGTLNGIEWITSEMLKALEDKDLTDAKQIEKECIDKDIQILAFGDAAYPTKLKNIDDPPFVLYCRGIVPDLESVPVIAAVGTRKATAYGMSIARQMGRQIAYGGALMISGAASGIDSMAMLGAMDAGKPTVGVLGCGVDVVYPKSNKALFEKVLENGCLLSECPPGTPPYKWNFPRRNRILSGMANGVLVVEAPEISGALITARLANDQGRDVFVVPGNVNVAACAGSNALLREYAHAACTGWDVIKEYAPLYPGKLKNRDMLFAGLETENPYAAKEKSAAAKVAQKPLPIENRKTVSAEIDKKGIDNRPVSLYSGKETSRASLTEEEQAVVSCMGTEPEPVDEVIARLDMPAGKVLGILTMLALKGTVVNYPGKRVALKTQIPS